MGLFNRNKKIENQENKKKIERHMITLPDGENGIFVFDINDTNKVQHSNKEITKLITARIIKYNISGTMISENADYIAFELPTTIELTDEILKNVMLQYDKESQNINYQSSYYIGRLQQDEHGYTFGNKSKTVEQLVSQKVKKEINERQVQRQKAMEENKRLNEQRKEEFIKSLDANPYINRVQREKEERKANPYIKEEVSSERNGRKYYNYDGVNINTGEILEMRMVDKVGKDGSGTYLYTAFLNNSEKEHGVQILGDRDPNGYAVCFELQKRLEDIVKDNNAEEIKQILVLLSDEKNFENSNILKYVGEIDKNGKVNHKMQSSSKAIQAEIIKRQKAFSKKMQQRIDIREGDK